MNQDLINQLSQDLEPVSGSAKSWKVSMLWLIISGLVLGGFVAMAHRYRDDLPLMMHSFRWIWMFVALLLFSGFAAVQALRSGVPGKPALRSGNLILFLIGVSVLIPAGMLLSREPATLAMTGFDPRTGWHCSLSVFLYSLLPAAALLFFFKKKLAVTEPEVTGKKLGFAVGGLGAAILMWCCPINEAVHLIVWHLIPIFILVWIFASLAKKYLRF